MNPKIPLELDSMPPQPLEVVLYPDKRLSQKSEWFLNSIPDNVELKELLANMATTLKAFNALGLSAIQVGVPYRIFVLRDPKTDEIVELINPTVVESVKETTFEDEGCLSFPGVVTRILRPQSMVGRYMDRSGVMVERRFDGLMARAFYHELDHLNGETFIQRMNFVQKASVLKKFNKIKRKFKL